MPTSVVLDDDDVVEVDVEVDVESEDSDADVAGDEVLELLEPLEPLEVLELLDVVGIDIGVVAEVVGSSPALSSVSAETSTWPVDEHATSAPAASSTTATRRLGITTRSPM